MLALGAGTNNKGSAAPATGSYSPDAALDQPKQLVYQPKSTAPAIGTLVPANMQTGTAQALLRLERRVGELDDYVTGRLAYGTVAELHRHFSAEQIDAIALAVSNLENGSGFVLGDQTGIGKGRVVAAIIRYAHTTGRTPLFVTKDPPLYADMIRDLRDIGMPRFRPLVTNPDLKKLPLPDGRVLHTHGTNHGAVLRALQSEGRLRGYDAIFTTYTQLQTVKGKEPERRTFLRTFAPNSIIILDESHEAGGSTGTNRKQETLPNRADFARELVRLSQGVLYSSATYAKDPTVMDLYFRTDMRLALSNMANLTELVASGGVPLQQTLASMLTEAGQYVRRERSFTGVRFDPVVVPVGREVAENISRIMAEIMEFDRLKQGAVKGMDRELKAEAKATFGDNSTGGAGATSTNFTSIMHNVLDQMLFALKAEETVERTLALLRQPEPEKPVLALSNTMGSLIARQAELQELQPGDTLDMDFGALLHRYLERSRDVILGNPWGEKSRHRLSDEELGIAATAKYHAICTLIDETDFRQIPVSPIDYITFRLNQEGYRIGEVTGRDHIAVYTADGTTLYQRRSHSERSKEAAVRTVKAFNDGRLDAIILNRSGSTGISLHASEHFPDRRQRHMLVVQAEADINQFMQMLGRVHRTGQVVQPNFTLLMADIPAEKRPGAVLARKMASLNANTTAARSGGFSLGDIPDFMNKYGDRVASDIMKACPDLHERLDYPLAGVDGAISSEGAIRKVTGRIPLLPIDEQEALYDLIEQQYTEYVAAQEAMGESILEASTLNLDARTLARMEVLPADAHSGSPFTGAVYAEILDVKAPRKPYTTLQVAGKLCQALQLPPIGEVSPETFADILETARTRTAQETQQLREAAMRYKGQVTLERAAAVDNQLYHVTSILEEFPIGQPICLTTERGDVFYGVVAGVKPTGASNNPVAASSWEIRLLLADSLRELTLPLSQVNAQKANMAHLAVTQETPQGITVYDLFDHLQTRTRETRQIFTGNLLRAWEKFPGKMVNFTDAAGNIRQGLLTPRGFDAGAALEHIGVTMPTLEDAWRFLSELGGQLKTADQHLTIKPGGDGTFRLQTPKVKDSGGTYYLDDALLEAAGGEFFSIGDRMECEVAGERLEAVLTVLMHERNYALMALEQPEQARVMLGMERPQFARVEAPSEPPPADIPEPIEPPVTAEAETKAPPLSQTGQQTEETTAPAEPAVIPPPTAEVATNALSHPPTIAPPGTQSGRPERNVAKLLEQGGLLDTILQGEDFHLRIENEPYIPLVIERHDNQIYLTHYLSQNRDTYIDSEMVFALSPNGALSLQETAVSALGGELRYCDRSFATLFSRNLLEQGFGEAITQSRTHATPEPAVIEASVSEELPMSAFDAQDSEQCRDEPENNPAVDNSLSPSEQNVPKPYPSVQDISLWAMAVRDLAFPEPAQRSVQKLYWAVRDGEQPPMSPDALTMRTRDMEQYHPYRERGQQVLDATAWILAHAGSVNAQQETIFKGNTYEIIQAKTTLTVKKHCPDRTEVILQAQDNRITRSTVTPQDALMFGAFIHHLQTSRAGRSG